jgi:hypothetical protein
MLANGHSREPKFFGELSRVHRPLALQEPEHGGACAPFASRLSRSLHDQFLKQSLYKVNATAYDSKG